MHRHITGLWFHWLQIAECKSVKSKANIFRGLDTAGMCKGWCTAAQPLPTHSTMYMLYQKRLDMMVTSSSSTPHHLIFF